MISAKRTGHCEPDAAESTRTDHEVSVPARAELRVVRGNPTPEELAALVVAFSTYAESAEAARPAPRISRWADRRAALRRPLVVGPGAWAASGREQAIRTRAGP